MTRSSYQIYRGKFCITSSRSGSTRHPQQRMRCEGESSPLLTHFSDCIDCHRINSRVRVTSVIEMLNSSNALSLLQPHDIILDCTDNAPTRYLLSDTAVRLGKPLVSGAAQRYEGQLCIYNLGKDGPCYRCIFPKPAAAESTGSCEETGILGAVTGIIGNMQALETIKLITGLHGRHD